MKNPPNFLKTFCEHSLKNPGSRQASTILWIILWKKWKTPVKLPVSAPSAVRAPNTPARPSPQGFPACFWVWVWACFCLCICKCRCVCVCICICLCIWVCMCICIWYAFVCGRIRSYAFAFVFGMVSNAYRCFFTEMHFVASPPALEEALRGVARGGIRNTPLAVLWVLSDEGKYRTAGERRSAVSERNRRRRLLARRCPTKKD